jgi:hypothetical protein
VLLRFVGFTGANLALHPLLLPEGVGVASLNQKPGSGDLRPWNQPATVATVPGGIQTIYRMGRDVPSEASYWLAWSPDVDVARGFIETDTVERTFWTGDGVPSWTDTSLGLGSAPYPDSSGVRPLGVPQPNSVPTLAQQVAGTGDNETRAYVVTWVNDRGEESMPSAAATITCKPGATIRVTRNSTIPSGGYGIESWRIYRTVAGAENDYYFVAEVDDAAPYFDETGQINTASPLLSESWAMPPATLKGLKALWNGILAAFDGKSLRFCEPFRPFAWPSEYELLVDDTIVALARWRQNLIVLTVGQPYIVTGSSPAAMSMQPIELNQACVAKLGVVELGHGVVWPSPDGLTYLGDGGARLLTAGLARREQWQALVPSSLIAGEHEGLYLASYDAGSGRAVLQIDPLAPVGLYFGDAVFTACHRDPILDALYVLSGTSVKRWDGGTDPMSASWTSGLQRLPKPTNLGWGQVVADSYPVTISIWADGRLRVKEWCVKDRGAFRLPSGFRAEQWQVRVDTDGKVQAVALAHTIEELNAA